MATLFKICPACLWQSAKSAGVFRGSEADVGDGFIHLSTADQVRQTAAKHFAGAGDLVLVAVDETALGPGLRYDRSPGGEMFPHLYGLLVPAAAIWIKPLPLAPDGRHVFPDLAL